MFRRGCRKSGGTAGGRAAQGFLTGVALGCLSLTAAMIAPGDAHAFTIGVGPFGVHVNGGGYYPHPHGGSGHSSHVTKPHGHGEASKEGEKEQKEPKEHEASGSEAHESHAEPPGPAPRTEGHGPEFSPEQ